ncbi:unnamed protein product [Sphagnum jensenii]|jgi:hypothetical protein|uniref:Uncharacterized protein n=1 Tax=Sphagnum jensenii TaxID=128206 RepID=A0ABP0WYJ2_9BRYO
MLRSLCTACADAYISEYHAQALDKLEMVCSDGEDCVSLLILSRSPHVCLWTEVLGTCLLARMLWLPADLHSSPTVSLISAQAQRNMCVLPFLSFCVFAFDSGSKTSVQKYSDSNVLKGVCLMGFAGNSWQRQEQDRKSQPG